MPAAEPRKCIAQVTEETRDAWRDFCDRHQIDRTAFAEVLGLWMADAPEPLPQWMQQIVDDARDLKNQRRRRG